MRPAVNAERRGSRHVRRAMERRSRGIPRKSSPECARCHASLALAVRQNGFKAQVAAPSVQRAIPLAGNEGGGRCRTHVFSKHLPRQRYPSLCTRAAARTVEESRSRRRATNRDEFRSSYSLVMSSRRAIDSGLNRLRPRSSSSVTWCRTASSRAISRKPCSASFSAISFASIVSSGRRIGRRDELLAQGEHLAVTLIGQRPDAIGELARLVDAASDLYAFGRRREKSHTGGRRRREFLLDREELPKPGFEDASNMHEGVR